MEEEIEALRGHLLVDAEGMSVYVKGHVDKAVFCAAVQREYGYEVLPDAVRHIWMHYGPGGDMHTAEYDYYQHLHGEGGRGRFKVTYYEVY